MCSICSCHLGFDEFASISSPQLVILVQISFSYDLVKIKNRSRKRSHKLDGIGVEIIRAFPFSSDSAYDLVKTRLSESEAEAKG